MELNRLEIPDNKLKQLEKKFKKLEDIAAYLPKRYLDLGEPVAIKDLEKFVGQMVTVVARCQIAKSSSRCVHAFFTDTDSGNNEMKVTWFQNFWLKKIKIGVDYVICGKIEYDSYFKMCSIISPILFTDELQQYQRYHPVYSKIQGMSDEYFKKCVGKAILLTTNQGVDHFDKELRDAFDIVDYQSFLKKAHNPTSMEDIRDTEKRQLLETLFPFAFQMEERNLLQKSTVAITVSDTSYLERFRKNLPFTLTAGQKQAVEELTKKVLSGTRIDSLIQGDVGCGKTVIAMAISALLAGNGWQIAVMCPTSVLAMQHFKSFQEMLFPLGIPVELYCGDMKKREKNSVLQRIRLGEANVVIGTHALITESVEFANLAMIVIDEEHRFGVKQREMLRKKGSDGIHCISMSATPIPRTVAIAMYGETVDVINIDSMPDGRKPVETIIYSNEEKVYKSIYKQLQSGHQAYIVCPLIEDSDSEMLENVESVETTAAKMRKWASENAPEIRILEVSGNMKQEEIASRLEKFAIHEADVLISTTIVEVGINVPNATVIMIKNAERFGLAQLHQLRGRVGRGNEQSYCVLLTDNPENERLRIMAENTDGFYISMQDLHLRGSGNLVGTQQSGIDQCVTLMLRNVGFYGKIKEELQKIFKDEKRLNHYKRLFSREY